MFSKTNSAVYNVSFHRKYKYGEAKPEVVTSRVLVLLEDKF